MSLTYGFYNSQNHDRVYDADDMSRIFDGIITDGVYAHIGKCMYVRASDQDNEVIVQPGRAWFNHTWTYIDVDYPMQALDAETVSMQNRLDALVIDVNRDTRTNSLQWVKGTAMYGGDYSTLPKPVLLRTEEHSQYPLCYVLRRGRQDLIKASEIYNAIGVSISWYENEADYHEGHTAITGVLTPFVEGVLGSFDISGITARWESEFDSWCDAQKEAFTIWMQARQDEYDYWFNNIKGTLSGDIATNLKNYIDSLTSVYTGSKSGTSVRKQVIQIGGTTWNGVTIPVTNLTTIYGSQEMEKTHTLKDNQLTTCTFTNSILSDTAAAVDVYTNPQVDYRKMTRSGNTVTIEFPSSFLGTINVRLRILTELA